MYLACIINGAVSPFIMMSMFESPMTVYFICTAILLSQLYILFKGRLMAIFGVTIGSLLHLYVLRAIIVSVFSLSNGISMNEIISNAGYSALVNLYSFAAQIVSLILFTKFVPLKTVKVIMADKSFYSGLLGLAILLNVYMIYNSNIFLMDAFSENLAVQEIVIATFTLAFFYIMMLMLIKIFNLGIYKEKTKELEVKIDKDKSLTSAMLNFAELILEMNCSQDKVTRILVNSVERPTDHLPLFTEFISVQSTRYTHPDDKKSLEALNCKSLISDYETGQREKVIDFRSQRIIASNGEIGVMRLGEEYYWYRMRINLNKDDKTSDIMALITIDEIDEEKLEELELRQKAETDPLTGAYNKKAFAHRVDRHIHTGVHGTLIMFDLDNFKGINDNMGHSAGDDVLREVHDKIKSLFRSNDIIGRVGGDEFVVFLTGDIIEANLERKAKELCEKVNKIYRADNGVDIEISSSVGVAVSPKDGNDFEQLFDAADVAMYHSKGIGKNTYTFYSSEISNKYKPQEREAYMRQRNDTETHN